MEEQSAGTDHTAAENGNLGPLPEAHSHRLCAASPQKQILQPNVSIPPARRACSPQGQSLLAPQADRGASSAGATFFFALGVLQGVTLPLASSAVTQISLHERRCAGNALSPRGEGCLVCTCIHHRCYQSWFGEAGCFTWLEVVSWS